MFSQALEVVYKLTVNKSIPSCNMLHVCVFVFSFQAKKFEKTTSKLIQKKRWGKKKMFVFIGIGATVAVVILGLIIYFIVPGTQ